MVLVYDLKLEDHVEKETTPTIVALGNIKLNIFFVTLEINEYILESVEEHLEELEGLVSPAIRSKT